MGAILKIALRNMKRRKIRYILTTITLVISVALFGGVMIVSDSFNEMMLKTIDEQLGTADILIRSANSTDGWFEPDEINIEIEDLRHVESIAYRISGFNVYISATDTGNQVENSTRTGIYGIDHQNVDERELGGKPFILDSVSNDDTIEELLDYTHEETGDKVIIISESLKIQLGKDFKANDSVWILPNDGEILGYDPLNTGTWLEYTVVAIIRDIGEGKDFDPENPSESTMNLAGFGGGGQGIFIDINNVHELVDGTENHTGEYNLGVVGVDDIYSVSSVVENIENTLEDLNDSRDWKVYDLKSNNLEMISTTMVTLETVFLIFGLVALVLSIILMMNIFNIIKKEQEYETGMFQAIGASKSETFKMFLIQGIVMGLIGTTIGTIASYFISYVIFSVTLQSIGSIAEQFGGLTISNFEIVLLPMTLIITFVVGLVSCIFASLYPSWKASRKPIIECLNPIEEKSKREKKHYWKRIILFILGGLLISSGALLMIFTPETTTSFAPTTHSLPGMDQGMVVTMFAPILILFGIIWLLVSGIKPLNKAFVVLFYPYLRKTKLLTERNILRHRKRTILTFIMIALTTSFLIGMTVMMDSMRAGIGTTIDGFMGADIRLYTFNTPRSFEEGLANQSGVDDVMGVSHQNAQIQINNEWVGHSLLDSEYNTTIMVNILDTEKVKEHLTKTTIISPTTMTLNEIMDEIKIGNNIIIDEDIADDYNLNVGGNLPLKFSLGTTYANLTALLMGNDYNVHEDTFIVNMTIIAIVRSIEGFVSLDLLGVQGQGKTYNTFISWETYEEIANKNLPGGVTDLVFRQLTQTGNPMLDLVQPNWFNFSIVEGILKTINGIDYYTTRMDYFTLTAFNGSIINYAGSSVAGIHTNSTGKLKSDSYFGNNSLVGKKIGYIGSTMEELLNTTENVCVVDETFIKNNPTIGIGDNITIFPQQYILETIEAGTPPYITTLVPYNYSLISGNTANLAVSDDIYLSVVSNQKWLAFNITTTLFTPNLYKAINVTIETSVNASVDKLDLEALNIYTNTFESLGPIKDRVETNNTFTFDLNHYYVDPMNNIKLRIVGYNSTYNTIYNLTIDSLKFGVARSAYPINALIWPKFEIIGIIEAPTLYKTEKYNWYAGFESGYDISGNSIFINYEKARNIIYSDYRGSDYSNDMVTSVLVHCDHPENIATYKNLLLQNLDDMAGGDWSIVDLKTSTLHIRTNVYDWFTWVEKGVHDEDVLEEQINYIEDRGYLIIFAFTKSFMSSTFRTMINLIVFITNGLLIFAIIIAMIGLTLHSLLTTMARRREIGMLRSIGLSKKGVIRSISGESLILALLGVLTGIFAGIIQGTLMVNAMPTGGFLTVTWTIPWLTIVILVLTVLITVILGSRYPAKWAANLNIIDAVRTR